MGTGNWELGQSPQGGERSRVLRDGQHAGASQSARGSDGERCYHPQRGLG
jgi:hypothetical protein